MIVDDIYGEKIEFDVISFKSEEGKVCRERQTKTGPRHTKEMIINNNININDLLPTFHGPGIVLSTWHSPPYLTHLQKVCTTRTMELSTQ